MNDIVPVNDPALPMPELPQSTHENPVLAVHRHLRGRYRLALLLALLLGAPLAAIAYLCVPPAYTSTVLIRVAPQITLTLAKPQDIPEAQVPAYFDSFVGGQSALIGSRRVLDMALSDEKFGLRAAGWPAAPEGLALLSRSLDVSNRRATELIVATVKHKNPVLAQKAANAVLDAYNTVREETGSSNITSKERDLRDRQTQLQNELGSLRGQVDNFAMQYGTDDVEQLQTAKLAEIVKYDNMISSLDVMLVQHSDGQAASPGPQPDGSSDLLLAQQDQGFMKLLDQESSIETEMERMNRTVTKEHREYKALQRRLDAVHAEMDLMRRKLAGLPHDDAHMAANPSAMSPEQMSTMRDRYVKLREAASTEAMKLEHTKTALASLKDHIAELKQNLDDTTRTLDQIKFENRAGSLSAGRVSILQRGDLPIEPSTDRRIPLAILGLLAGAGIGVGIVLLSGVVNGGYRYIDELERSEGNVPLLGTVPDLKSADPEHESMAALSVHHLRNILQLQFERTPGGKVFTITSAAAGDGKTSLALALGMSFAATGKRTIIVDTDLVGRGMTRQLEMAGIAGLCDAVRANKINGDIHTTKIASLWAMPAGVVQGFVPEHLSSSAVARILAELRTRFDAIILDTGPVMGSLEANVVAPASDGVVLVVSRGQPAKTVRASIQRLRRLGATCSGLIFNRATTKDFDRSVSTTSVSARSIRASAQAARRGGAEGRAALMRAVAAPAVEPEDSAA
jgi:capsular exopolysaccharide synthesis family protein